MALKKTSFFLLLIVTSLQVSVAQRNSATLAKADSLFQMQKYTESYELYNNIYSSNELFSTQMLLKMAYIKEGLGDFSNALYFLENYYRKTNDKNTLAKINEIVEQEQLQGYEYNDFTFVTNYATKQKKAIAAALFTICLFLAIHIVWTKQKRKLIAKVSLTLLLLCSGVLVFSLNSSLNRKEGIIVDNNAFAMKKPSGAADIHQLIDKGDKVKIASVGDIWTQVLIEEKKLFIRTNKIGLLL